MNVVLKLRYQADTNFPCTFSILNGVRIKITHNIAPIILKASINITGVQMLV